MSEHSQNLVVILDTIFSSAEAYIGTSTGWKEVAITDQHIRVVLS
jgi:hypothetical protein